MFNHLVRFAVASIFAVALTVATAIPAFAAPLVDFTSAAWAGADNQFAYAAQGATAVSNPLFLSTLQQDPVHGMGISSVVEADPNEIGRVEWMDVFLGAGMMLDGFSFGKLFKEPGPLGGTINERLSYRINGGGWNTVQAPNGNTPGGLGQGSVSFATQLVTSITFGIDSPFNSVAALGSNFTIRSLDGQLPTPPAVPEPGTMILLGTGLLGIASRARKRLYPAKS